jgi:tricorn protease
MDLFRFSLEVIMRRLAVCSITLLLSLSDTARAQQDEARLLRFPTIHGKHIVFTYAGNLYTVASTGGVARRLTSHEGFEMFPHFSPDGKWIAFTGQYDGNTEVYLMPAEGGVPKRLTYTATLARDDVSDRMGPNNIVMGWKHDGKHIVFRSRMHDPNPFIGQLFLVPAAGGLPQQLPLPRGGFCSYSPDDSKLVYNRIFREFRTWKRYRGGMADDLWIYDFATKKTENITSNPAQDIIPMWHRNKIYFLSDRDKHKRMNLYVHDTTTKETRQLTDFADFDIKFPTLGDTAIVFEYAGYIYRFDLDGEKAVKVPIRILEDHHESRTQLHKVGKEIASYEISPDGKRALFSARGDLFTVPAKQGPTRNLTGTPGVHDRNPKWSPDGKAIAYISDASGEDEIYTITQDGSAASVQLTKNGDTYKYALEWSPDSKKILWSDKKLRLQYLDVATKAVKPVDTATAFEIRQYVWSPDSKWVAYAKPEEEGMQRIYLYSLEQGKSYPVTNGWYASSSPAFSGDGKYLFFVSQRDFNPVFSATEFNHAYLDMARIYVALLSKETPSPFQPKSDEVEAAAEEKIPAEKKPAEKKETAKPADLKVDIDGIKERTLQLPIAVGRYGNLASVGATVYYFRASSKDPKPAFFLYDLTAQKETPLGSIDGYEISANQKKMLVAKGANTYTIIDLPKGTISGGDTLKLDGMEVTLDRHAEWNQIFHECWRQMRDFFYDPNMHGVDWKAMRERYGALVKHVNHRADLTYIIGEMIGELNAGHCYVGGGDMPRPPRVLTGLLGARLEQDPATKYVKIAKILKGAHWDKTLRSPLTEPGVNVKEGEYIIAVDGRPTNEMINIYEALVNKVGQQVKLRVNSTAAEKGSREVMVTPIGDEQPLYYYNWVQRNIQKVDEATDGKVGYLHVPDMQLAGLNEFAKHFYPQVRKKALIIDVRGNGGGNVSPQLIERLRREIVMMKVARNTAQSPDPAATLNGPMVCLLNEFSASDGDLFPYRFKSLKMGKLIGKRSWGGVIGIRGTLPLLDGGSLQKPEFATYARDGKSWIIEGYGVDPDIVVDNDPAREYAGIDDQLNRAIRELQAELKRSERTLPPVPPYPNKKD